jgi:Ca-activated chloride channel family protein
MPHLPPLGAFAQRAFRAWEFFDRARAARPKAPDPGAKRSHSSGYGEHLQRRAGGFGRDEPAWAKYSQALSLVAVLGPLVACTASPPGPPPAALPPAEVQAAAAPRAPAAGDAAAAQQPAAAPDPQLSKILGSSPLMQTERSYRIERPRHLPEADADTARQHVKGRQLDPNPVRSAAADPVSTFSVDVDTGSYSSVRGLIDKGMDVPGNVVRVEEMVNYFDYAYPRPEQGGSRHPFAISTALAPSPWNPGNHLLRIGLQAADVAKDDLPPANLVFLIDVSGSMNIPQSLPLVQDAMVALAQRLRPQDRVSIVTYASGTQVWLPATPGSERETVVAAIRRLHAGGSTAGASGIRLAYEQARRGFIPGGINRILLATDGDFNVGVSDVDQLKEMVARQRAGGIGLSTLGVGHASYNDALMEQVADAGDGKYSFLDSLEEAHKVLVNEFTSTLHTVAQDVKIQVEFNPAVVKEYRLIGYENRQLAREDFRNDRVDAGDIGAGHRVTALYEITLQGRPGLLEPLRYGSAAPATPAAARAGELAHLRLRYKRPGGDPTQAASLLVERAIEAGAAASSAGADADFRFAAAVAAFGQLLGQATHMGSFGFADVAELARSSLGDDAFGQRREFVALAERMAQRSTGSATGRATGQAGR